MQDKIIATFCILDDLLKMLNHRDDPQAKAPDSEILTIAILACQEFAGNLRKTLQWVKALRLFSCVPSESRFSSWHDWTGLYGMALEVPDGGALFMDRGYTDYCAEDVLGEADGIAVYPVRRRNAVRYSGYGQYLAVVKRRFVESVGSCLHSLLPRRVHAVTLDGFVLKMICFIFAHNLNLLHKVAS